MRFTVCQLCLNKTVKSTYVQVLAISLPISYCRDEGKPWNSQECTLYHRLLCFLHGRLGEGQKIALYFRKHWLWEKFKQFLGWINFVQISPQLPGIPTNYTHTPTHKYTCSPHILPKDNPIEKKWARDLNKWSKEGEPCSYASN